MRNATKPVIDGLTDRHSMVITRKELQLQDGSRPYLQMYYSQNNSGNQQTDYWKEIVLPVVLVFMTGVVFLLLRTLYCDDREVIILGGDRVGQPSPESNEEAGEGPAAKAAPLQQGEPAIVCTYRKDDDELGESSCGVCLADLADGEALRVLPACMHYFHAVCVNEWLRAHNTCPLCRTLLVVPTMPPIIVND